MRGFTLIELSVVIIIIGLIVAAVIAGQTLIRQAQLRHVITELKNNEQAFYNFIQEFNALPGDFTRASNYWPVDCTDTTPIINLCNGNGDRRIGFLPSAPNNTYEENRAWQHMALANLIPGPFDGSLSDIPAQSIAASAFNNGGYIMSYLNFPVHNVRNRHYINLSAPSSTIANSMGDAILSPVAVHGIDQKIDDGLAASGQILSDNGGPDFAGCFTLATTSYALTTTLPECVLYYIIK